MFIVWQLTFVIRFLILVSHSRWIIKTMVPLSITDNEATSEMMNVFCPQFAVPSRRTVVRDLNKLYENGKKDAINLLFGLKTVATTADSWTAHCRAFLGVTCHWLDPATLERKHVVLACKELKVIIFHCWYWCSCMHGQMRIRIQEVKKPRK